MPSTFLGLNTGVSGLNYYQATLNTAAHNISNASTKGYSRQYVLSQASVPIRLGTSYGMQGTGVTMTGIQQFRNSYYDTKYRASTSKKNQYSSVQEQLSQLESYLNEIKTESGYTKLYSKLSDALQDLAGSPSDATYRTQMIQAADNFTDLINETAVNYQNSQISINNEIAIHVDTINSISSQIYALNQQIINIETRNGNANDLRDQRELLVDQLSELVNVTVTETPITYGDGFESGAYRYEVRIGTHLLVDDMQCNKLKVVAREEKVNQNDADGLYDVYWTGLHDSLGDEFDFNSSNITGKIKGLIEVRDGNNANPFSGTTKTVNSSANGTSVLVELPEGIAVDKLNIPENGMITLNCENYYYEGFEAVYDADGKLNSFTFKNITSLAEDGSRVPATLNDVVNKPMSIGEKVDCKGIPYYMEQLNEFTRTLSKYMNDIFTTGVDANGDKGLDFFTAADSVTGKDYILTTPGSNQAGAVLSSGEGNYYRVNAFNWSVNQSIYADQSKLVVSYAEDIAQGNKDAKGILDKIIYGFTDQNMFSQGTVSQFMQAVTTSLAVDTSKYDAFQTNMDEVATVIDNQRLSVSNVDKNEEAASLVIYQEGYNLASKVISVMNEIYDKLINQTGV
mgnify:FL=1